MAARTNGWSEDRLHRWLQRTLSPRGVGGRYGSDAAVLARSLRRPVLCVDAVVEGVHYTHGTSPAVVGFKAAGRSLSDLAATAAEPRALLLSMCLPPGLSEAWIRRVILAVQARGRFFGAELVGGGLACAPGPAVISVSASGDLPGRRSAPGRDRARPGQLVVLTGPVGGSLLGRHLRVVPRVAEGRWLWECGATAMMDVSDGLARDLGRIGRLSGVRIDLERVPLHRDARKLARRSRRNALDHGLYDGEDYELIATLAPSALARVLREKRKRCPTLQVIGRVRRGAGLYVPTSEGSRELQPYDARRGWSHGG